LAELESTVESDFSRINRHAHDRVNFHGIELIDFLHRRNTSGGDELSLGRFPQPTERSPQERLHQSFVYPTSKLLVVMVKIVPFQPP
jgi:hypothetical protein